MHVGNICPGTGYEGKFSVTLYIGGGGKAGRQAGREENRQAGTQAGQGRQERACGLVQESGEDW